MLVWEGVGSPRGYISTACQYEGVLVTMRGKSCKRMC